MKIVNRALVILALLLMALSAYGQDITGQWSGAIEVSGIKLRIIFNITKTDTGYVSTMDSPDQGAKGLAISSTTFSGMALKLEQPSLRFVYEGVLNKESVIEGKLTQAGQVFPLNLSREELAPPVRPQEPKLPFPYYSENITFENTRDKVTLAGTLTLPKREGKFPAVVLVTGSGPQNRDEELLGHKPFLLLSDYLTRNGIAVLRYDDRGIAESKGIFGTATTLDFSYDAEAAVNYLKARKEIDNGNIGILGHSEGGEIAPMIAARRSDIKFIVLLAGPGLPGGDLMLLQKALIERASGAPEEDVQVGQKVFAGAYDLIRRSSGSETLAAELTAYFKQAFTDGPLKGKVPPDKIDEAVKPIVNQLSSAWMANFIKLDPATALEKVKCPVLALDGTNDLQVPSKVNLAAIKASLEKARNKDVTIVELPGLNHLFQESRTGAPEEYGKIEQTMAPVVLDTILKWIQKQVK